MHEAKDYPTAALPLNSKGSPFLGLPLLLYHHNDYNLLISAPSAFNRPSMFW